MKVINFKNFIFIINYSNQLPNRSMKIDEYFAGIMFILCFILYLHTYKSVHITYLFLLATLI